MKRLLMILVVLLAIVSIAAPSFAVDFKYGGMWRGRLQSNDNVSDGDDHHDDQGNWIDQRLRMYFTFVSSENLQVVTKWEHDALWGAAAGGGDVGADAVALEMKNSYLDFAIPNTPARAKIGIQGVEFLKGWIVSDDFSAAVVEAPFTPFKVTLGYIAAVNEDVTDTSENVDDVFLSVDYANGPFKAALVGFYQFAHDRNTSVDPGLFGGDLIRNAIDNNGDGFFETNVPFVSISAEDNNLFDLGLSLEYKQSLWSAYINGVKNFGGADDVRITTVAGTDEDDVDYEGWMVEGGASLYCGPFTFSVGGFVTSGDDLFDEDDDDIDGDIDGFFRYPAGRSHYWAEILGLGTLDVNARGAAGEEEDRVQRQAGYAAADGPSNLWMVTAGIAWQALEGTKLTLNYYYIGTVEDVVSHADFLDADDVPINDDVILPFNIEDTDNSIGHELDFYLDQKIVDKLSLRLVGAYLFADDAYTINEDDDDAYEVGAQLLWAF